MNSMMNGWRSVVCGCGAAAVGGLLLTACSSNSGGTLADPGSIASASTSASGSASASRTPATLTQGSYVALGDSYTAGPDIPTQDGTPAGCDRSSSNYPSLVAQSLGFPAAQVRDMSCSGATIADLTSSQSTSDGVNPDQLSALSPSTTLVTLGITSADLVFLDEEELRLNDMLQASAKAAGAVYVNTYTPSQGHDACTEPSVRWTEPLDPASPAAPLHPNARGEQAMADAVLSAIKSSAS